MVLLALLFVGALVLAATLATPAALTHGKRDLEQKRAANRAAANVARNRAELRRRGVNV